MARLGIYQKLERFLIKSFCYICEGLVLVHRHFLKPRNVSGQLSSEKNSIEKITIKIRKLKNFLTPSCAEKSKIEKRKIDFFCRNLIRILITFLENVHFCICKLLAEKRNAENSLSNIETWKTKRRKYSELCAENLQHRKSSGL